MKVKRGPLDEYVRSVIKPGAVLVSYGIRGGGKTHCAVSFCQRLMEGYFEGAPSHVVLVTNIIFVRKKEDGGFETKSPPGVYTITCMKDLFPIVVDTVEKYGNKDTLIILLLDEAQHFLLGDDNNKSEMASSMKKFSGIIRKFCMALWLITPTPRNLGPAFRNFIDADTDPANVTCTFKKDAQKTKAYLRSEKAARKKMKNADPRSFVWCQASAHEEAVMLPVPTSSWTKNPDDIAPGSYVYDNMSSADFGIEDFPFREFVRCISGKSSYEMIPTIKQFYAALESGEIPGQETPTLVDVEKAVHQRELEILKRCMEAKLTSAMIAQILGIHPNTVTKWKKKLEETEQKGDESRPSSAALLSVVHEPDRDLHQVSSVRPDVPDEPGACHSEAASHGDDPGQGFSFIAADLGSRGKLPVYGGACCPLGDRLGLVDDPGDAEPPLGR